MDILNKIDSCKKFFLLVIPMDPITKTWKFKYDDERDPLMKKHTKGYYLNLENGDVRSFEEGIAHIVGKAKERYVYHMWWIENGSF